MVFSFLRRWREQGRKGIAATVRTQSESLDDDMAWFFPPCVHDCAVWDRYWQGQATHGLTPPLFDMFCHDAPLIQCLIKRGAKTLLCAGDGISQEPRALAAAGFEVTAIDFSPAAVHLAESWQFCSKELDSSARKNSGGRAGPRNL